MFINIYLYICEENKSIKPSLWVEWVFCTIWMGGEVIMDWPQCNISGRISPLLLLPPTLWCDWLAKEPFFFCFDLNLYFAVDENYNVLQLFVGFIYFMYCTSSMPPNTFSIVFMFGKQRRRGLCIVGNSEAEVPWPMGWMEFVWAVGMQCFIMLVMTTLITSFYGVLLRQVTLPH